jgi:hypothetical protein
VRGRDLNPRPLGYELNVRTARPCCSTTYVRLTPLFSLMFGRNRSLPALTFDPDGCCVYH